MPTADVLDVILRLSNVRQFQAGAHQAAASMKEVQKAATGANSAGIAASKKNITMMGLVKKASKVTAAGAAVAIYEAYKMGTAFDSEMLKIQTETGQTHKEMLRMRQGVIDLATSGKSMGAGPNSLAMGLYHIESLGIRGQKALDALTYASQLSAISGADLEETTSALGAAMYVGIKGTGGLEHITSLMNATVGQGNMRMSELVHALGTGVLPAARIAGLSIQDVMAALTVFTDSGQQASSAAAQFATALNFVKSPTDKAKNALAQLGIGQTQLAEDMHKPNGMVTMLQDLRDHLEKLPGGLEGVRSGQILGSIFPAGRGRVLQTELVMLDRAKNKWDLINKTSTVAAQREHVRAQKNNPATQLSTALAKLQGDLIHFYDEFKGPGTKALVGILHALDHLLNTLRDIGGFMKAHKGVVMAAVGAWVTYKAVMIGAMVATRAQVFMTNSVVRGMFITQAAEGAAGVGVGAEAGTAGAALGKTFAAKMGLMAAAGIAGWEIGSWIRKHSSTVRHAAADLARSFGVGDETPNEAAAANKRVDIVTKHGTRLHNQYTHMGGRGGPDLLSWQQRMKKDRHEQNFKKRAEAEKHYTNSIFGLKTPDPAAAPRKKRVARTSQVPQGLHASVPDGQPVQLHVEVPVHLNRREIARAVADEAVERQAHR